MKNNFSNQPISIVISTFNRLDYLKKCIEALLNIIYNSFEIIIVNDGSTDGTKEYLDSLTTKKIKVIHHETNRGLSAGRNTGIKNCAHDLIAFTDDDCIVDKNWLSELSKKFTDKNVGFVIGQTFYIHQNYQGYFPERLVRNIGAKWPMGCNIAYRKSVFSACEGFDDYYFKYNNEDSEMAIRAVSHGFSYARALEAVVLHQKIQWSVGSLLKSAKNASVWPLLKKRYPSHYSAFKPKIKFGFIINIEDYLFLITLPIFIPLLFIRYIAHGKRDFKIFFTKWPVYLLLRRYNIYKEAVKNKVFMV